MRTIDWENGLVTAPGRSDGPMVLPRAFALLRLLAEKPDGMNLSDVAARLNVPKSSLAATLKALSEQNFLKRTGSLYSLGSESYTLASIILAGRELRQIAHPFLEKAMQESGETVLLAIMDSDAQHFSYVDSVESENSVRYSVSIGTRRPLYPTACGRTFLAWQTETFRRDYYKSVTLDTVTDKTITEPAALEKRLDDIRRKGVSVTLGDYSPDVAGFSAPIFNSEGKITAALAIGMPISRGQREQERFCKTVLQSARSISKILGHKEDR